MPEVKVKGLFTVASPVSEEVIERTTFVPASGCAFRTTVKVSVVGNASGRRIIYCNKIKSET